MLAIEREPASREEGIMLTIEKCMSETQPVIMDGQEWYHKATVIEAHPLSKPAAYAQLIKISDYLQTKRIGKTIYFRIDDTIDWRMELMAGAISVNDMCALNRWDSVSKIMRNSLEMTAMHNQIESYVSMNGVTFTEYNGIVNDIQKQLKEQARINSRLQRAFKKIGDA